MAASGKVQDLNNLIKVWYERITFLSINTSKFSKLEALNFRKFIKTNYDALTTSENFQAMLLLHIYFLYDKKGHIYSHSELYTLPKVDDAVSYLIQAYNKGGANDHLIVHALISTWIEAVTLQRIRKDILPFKKCISKILPMMTEMSDKNNKQTQSLLADYYRDFAHLHKEDPATTAALQKKYRQLATTPPKLSLNPDKDNYLAFAEAIKILNTKADERTMIPAAERCIRLRPYIEAKCEKEPEKHTEAHYLLGLYYFTDSDRLFTAENRTLANQWAMYHLSVAASFHHEGAKARLAEMNLMVENAQEPSLPSLANTTSIWNRSSVALTSSSVEQKSFLVASP